MAILTFSAERLRTGGNQGIIKPDAAGYYEMCIGGFNVANAGGAFYTAESATRLFSANGDLMRRLATRNLRGEAGHPRRPPGMSDTDWVNRCLDVDEARSCVYWSKFTLDESYGRNNPHLGNPEMVGVMGRFRPGGAMGDFLARDMEDPETDVSFSVRAFSREVKNRGRTIYDMQVLTTYDYVNEPGVWTSSKVNTGTSRGALTMESMSTTNISRSTVMDLVDTARKAKRLGSTMESYDNNVNTLAAVFDLTHMVSKPTYFIAGWK